MALQPREMDPEVIQFLAFQSPLTGQWPCNWIRVERPGTCPVLSVPSNGAMALQR